MPNMTAILTISSLERLKLSANGSPRFKVTFTNKCVAETEADSGANYLIENSEYADVPLKVTFNSAGRITHIERHNS